MKNKNQGGKKRSTRCHIQNHIGIALQYKQSCPAETSSVTPELIFKQEGVAECVIIVLSLINATRYRIKRLFAVSGKQEINY